jgi:hypothetical protein
VGGGYGSWPPPGGWFALGAAQALEQAQAGWGHGQPAPAEVLAVLRAAGTPLTAGQVRQRLAAGQRAELSYSTVVTIVSRLHAKRRAPR